ncbi:MAG: hypothetical protein LQ341_003957 [Variospora aurantia]|nr:MAG: hypothetical protein LQ341_003957 [Variospora aurantia]
MTRPSRAGSVSSRKPHRHNPLSEDLKATGPLRTKSNKRKSRPEEDECRYVDTKSSRKILKIGQDLVDEVDGEQRGPPSNPAFAFESRFADGEEAAEAGQYEDEEAWGDEGEELTEEIVGIIEARMLGIWQLLKRRQEIDPNDVSLFNKFMPSTTSQDHLIQPTADRDKEEDSQGRSLAEIILEKIAAHEANLSGQPIIQGGGAPQDAVELPIKVVEVYTKIGLILSRYKSGKLPKPFKIIPTLPQWQELLSITRPEAWTANACYEATRIFTSAKPQIAQQFLEMVILERVREDIHETKKLNVHLFNSLKKSTYRPAAFFKGFLFPLVSSGTCTLREAHIVSSVLVRISIPVLHSAAALLRLTEIAAEQTSVATESAGATNIFIRTLLEKKYALPYKVIDGLVFHFLRFRPTPQIEQGTEVDSAPVLGINDHKLPVLWHQSLLAFAQRYRNDITEDQREALLDLLLNRGHKDIGPEVRRELLAGRGRGVVIDEPGAEGGDDTMMVDHF